MKTSNDYSPAVAVWPSGKTQPCNVKRALLLQPDAATARLREAGTVCVYVRTREDADAVLRGSGVAKLSKPDCTYIYALVRNSDDCPFYVGKANVIERRRQQHKDNARLGHKGKLYTYIRKLWRIGDDFHAVRVCEAPFDAWNDYEVESIRRYREMGYDLKNVAPGGIAPKPSEESNRKISEALTGRPLSAAHREKLSTSHLGKPTWNKGKKTGKPGPMQSPEVRAKVSATLKGRKFTPEWLKKMSDAKKGKPARNKGERGVHGKRIQQIDPVTGEVLNTFGCLALALEHIGRKSTGSLSECATGKRKTAYGYKWAYCLD